MTSLQKYLLITGTIANRALASVVKTINCDLFCEVKSLRCSVAALMTTDFIARKLEEYASLSGAETIIIPGLCQGSLESIKQRTGCQVLRGPKDLKDLPAFLTGGIYLEESLPDISEGSAASPMQILAEIVDAPRLSLAEIIAKAHYYQQSGADIIDLGGDVHGPFPGLREVIRSLKAEGFKVSIDSHQREDILTANQEGVDLVLSLNSQNIDLGQILDCPAVLIPDDGEDLPSLYRTLELMEKWHKPYILDPILPPLTMGLAEGISRYRTLRRELPGCNLLMGLGNVTELVDADSTGINALMMGIATELNVNYILTTEVSHRARGAVSEASRARHLMYRASIEGRLPKHLDYGLLTIKDPYGNRFNHSELKEMQSVIKDKNFRIFVADKSIYIFNANMFLQGTSAQGLFTQLGICDVNHAFYLGRELSKAELALRLGKKYVQDDPLRWGYINESEVE
ncbi:DUF6513 domain-containing protein [Desulfosporosinus lacus]|uniref:Dihydropteroate synthase-related protein n=1 Tax=Desulfosporosinus lacus DSM 15449 TaxID=1121420 RepID=A0A1M6A173_9FIRM|nr:DUF6513 domain-containing protein [Desulfosporosinus lacus]SHI30232.1 dihydropteroate synthase-related protein [Desulfosporosinus lacus DSM 15449]